MVLSAPVDGFFHYFLQPRNRDLGLVRVPKSILRHGNERKVGWLRSRIQGIGLGKRRKSFLIFPEAILSHTQRV